jgi:hypothetical protein
MPFEIHPLGKCENPVMIKTYQHRPKATLAQRAFHSVMPGASAVQNKKQKKTKA